ncbi:Endonuclease/Exonuclease/phosphatase family protein [Novipirellula aureliae]|uniref:Endonuclease/Exonuclease/phosphatase family protein n=1 Tax=Novipirellula aureliae TaxID=2527966 RepID=A0A5C6EA31_9BACT|nr:endonuclease/exonuclease/phosphatase family protein [Novipirellula aureliae]TWU45570.1 Endonuclease/Exonuclease/phosphatase family protein [Novipirellula aureliae]
MHNLKQSFRCFGCLLIFAPLSSILSVGISAAEPEELSVMTWNLEWFFDDLSGDNYSELAKEKAAPDRTLWAWKRDAVAKSIAKAKPTIVAVQEIENRRVLWYLTRALDRDFSSQYEELCLEGGDHFTEQDVGLLYRKPADLILQTLFNRSLATQKDDAYFDVSKHIMAVFEFPLGNDKVERVTLLNVHLRARAEAMPLRIRQARLLQQWIGGTIRSGQAVILLGDLNTEETGDRMKPNSDMGVATGLETKTKDDDLVDLHRFLDRKSGQTHMITGKQFDRIMVSRSLIEDTPRIPDLVFKSIRIHPELNIQASPDDPEKHWEGYWEIPSSERDISDHYPVIATFEVK